MARLFASPGPIYEVQLEGEDPWQWAAALEACGIGVGDVVLNCFGYHLSPAGMMFDPACRAVGATVIPGGVGSGRGPGAGRGRHRGHRLHRVAQLSQRAGRGVRPARPAGAGLARRQGAGHGRAPARSAA
ncbi:hypothetical protein [Nocardioides sp. B-3]|uniref:hypothetical protein n=1 Tax=Nocardioides sp. B-3 TaxID=2895565 RepID=UPI002152F521|nr:hypothetical protein [Nocardioides sp. B-3]UUZ58521.1 hypothetical protein LP418_20490 [Nocardioides sp. B-3]